MKKSKILLPLMSIVATSASIAPLATLTSCNKQQEFKIEMTKGTKDKSLYADATSTSFYFQQNNVENFNKTKASIVNLKIDGADATVVSGLVKTSLDSAGGIRVTIKVDTIRSHYSNPSTIEFDLQFTNKVNKVSYSIPGFKLTIEEEDAPEAFVIENNIIQSLSSEIIEAKDDQDKLVNIFSSENNKKIFVPMDVPATQQVGDGAKILVDDEDNDFDRVLVQNATEQYYRMIIPSDVTGIAEGAFMERKQNAAGSTLPSIIKSLDFLNDSQLTSIGRSAFMQSPLIFVSLPATIQTLGEMCFGFCSSLVSVKFPSKLKHTNKLAIPEGFIRDCNVPYIKIPTYVNSIGKEAFLTWNAIYIDFSEWSNTLIKDNLTLGDHLFRDNLAGAFTSGGTTLQELNTKFQATHSQTTSTEIAYNIDTTSEVTIQGVSDTTKLTAALKYISESSPQVSGRSIFRFEFPNFYTPEDSTEPQAIVRIDPKASRTLINDNQYVSSIYVPDNLTAIPTPFGKQGTWTGWQVYIPYSVRAFDMMTFCILDNLCSFVYGGTGKQWDELIENSSSDWIEDCPEISVWCADGTTRTVQSTKKK